MFYSLFWSSQPRTGAPSDGRNVLVFAVVVDVLVRAIADLRYLEDRHATPSAPRMVLSIIERILAL
jgi:hypothetical protein